VITAKADALIFHEIEPVFRFVALEFPKNYPRWSPEVSMLEPLTSGPVQTGFQARQIRVDRGQKTDSIFEVSEMVAQCRVIFRGVTAPYVSTYEFEDLKASTRLTFTFELRELEPRLRPFEKLIRIALEDGAKRTVKRLKLLIEREMLDDY
jgi:Polyketide cyclase / dehydrase and lipid transport